MIQSCDVDMLMAHTSHFQSRRSESLKVPIMDTAVPMHLKGGGVKTTHGRTHTRTHARTHTRAHAHTHTPPTILFHKAVCRSVAAEPLVHEDGELKMKFKLMTKKGNKQQVGYSVCAGHMMLT